MSNDNLPPILSGNRQLSLSAAQGIPEKARKTGLARFTLVQKCRQYRDEFPGKKGDAEMEYLKLYNSGKYLPVVHSLLGAISIQTLRRWNGALGASSDWTLLCPNYHANKQTAPRLNPIEERIFFSLWLSPNKLSIGDAARLSMFWLKKNGAPATKCAQTFRRAAQDFESKHQDIVVLIREGQKALRDKIEPYIKRDPSVLAVGDALVADGHRLNFQVINPFTGKPCRATLLAYVDWKSYDLAGYEIMINENTQCIAAAMRNSIIRLGKMPLVSYQDNGKAFRGAFFTGDVNLEESGFYGLFGRLGIAPVFAKPYNARAKIVERWFKEFSDTFERLFPSFIGSSIADKPAYMLRNEKLHKALHNEYVPTIEEAVMLLECWLEFHRSQECPHVKGKSIGDVFNEGRGGGVNAAELDDLMMDMKITRLGRNGIRFLNQDYYNENLTGLKEQVTIRYSLFDLSYIKVYAMDGSFIGAAERVMPVHPLANVLGTPKDMEHLKQQIALQKRAEKKTVQGSKELLRLGKTAQLDWQRVIEISPRIADRLEIEGMQTPAIEEQIPEECVNRGDSPSTSHGDSEPAPSNTGALPVIPGQSPSPADVTRLEPRTRPTFDGHDMNLQRYYWHLEFGMFTEEDRAWVNWFMTTNEFRNGVLFFESQKREATPPPA